MQDGTFYYVEVEFNRQWGVLCECRYASGEPTTLREALAELARARQRYSWPVRLTRQTWHNAMGGAVEQVA